MLNVLSAKSAKTLLFASVTAFCLSACSNNQNTTAPEKTDAQASSAESGQVLRIATESSFKPFSYTDAEGNLVGFEIDLANALCQQMQAKCEISSQDWDGLIPGLTAQKFDAIMAGMSITPERAEVVQFSEPYFKNALVLVTKQDSPLTLEKLAGKSVAVQRATVAAQYLAEHYPKINVKLYDTQDNTYLDLKAGRVDGLFSDKVPALDWLKSEAGKGYGVNGQEIDIDDQVAIALRKNDPLVDKFNQALNDLKANGEYDKIVKTYFDAEQSAADPTQETTAPNEQNSTQNQNNETAPAQSS